MYYLYGIPNCDQVKKARLYLESNGITFEFIDFKKSPPSIESLTIWKKSFGGLPVNKKGQTYKKYASQFEALAEDDKIQFLIQYPSMIKRPILQKDKRVLFFGFNEDEFKKVLG